MELVKKAPYLMRFALIWKLKLTLWVTTATYALLLTIITLYLLWYCFCHLNISEDFTSGRYWILYKTLYYNIFDSIFILQPALLLERLGRGVPEKCLHDAPSLGNSDSEGAWSSCQCPLLFSILVFLYLFLHLPIWSIYTKWMKFINHMTFKWPPLIIWLKQNCWCWG